MMKHELTLILGTALVAACVGCAKSEPGTDQQDAIVTTSGPAVAQDELISRGSEPTMTHREDSGDAGEIPDDVDTQTLELLRIAGEAWNNTPLTNEGPKE